MMGGRWWTGVSLATLWCTLAAPAWAARHTEPPGKLWVEARQRSVHEQRSALSQVAQAALPAVVSITTTQPSTSPGTEGEKQKGIGSGLIIHPDGYVLTSAHVIEGADDIRISVLSEQGYPEEFQAELVGEDTRTDFALLKIDAGRKLPVLKLASASRVDVGDFVVVIGNPFGLTHSVTAGVVSAKGRTDVTPNGRDGSDFDYMQVDASINPGNSGGPVLDLHGDVVAIANAVNVAGQGIGFAIPVDIAKAVLPHLRKYGRVRRGWMGVLVKDPTPEVVETYGLEHPRGVVVSDVQEGGPASRAGLRVGDVIEGLDASKVERAHKLRWQVASRGVGHSVVLRVRRGERPLKLRVRLEGEPPETQPAEPILAQPSPAPTPDEQPATGGSGHAGQADEQTPGKNTPSP
jgi:serine protease Do